MNKKYELIKKIADIDAALCTDKYEKKMSYERRRELRMKRERLEKQLYK